jgi:hypothetical protein
MMNDKDLDALEKRLRSTHPNEDNADWCHEAVDTIAALRASPVAMRERAEGAALHEADLLKQRAAEADDAGHDTAADFYRESEQTARNIAALIRALPLDAPAPVAAELPPCCVCGSYMATRGEETLPNGQWVCCAKCKAEAPAPVDPVANGEWTEERFRAVMATLPKPTMTSEEITALTRDDAPPTLAEAMTVPEVRALVEALETLHVAATLMADRCGLRDCDEALDESSAILAKLKGGTP